MPQTKPSHMCIATLCVCVCACAVRRLVHWASSHHSLQIKSKPFMNFMHCDSHSHKYGRVNLTWWKLIPFSHYDSGGKMVLLSLKQRRTTSSVEKKRSKKNRVESIREMKLVCKFPVQDVSFWTFEDGMSNSARNDASMWTKDIGMACKQSYLLCLLVYAHSVFTSVFKFIIPHKKHFILNLSYFSFTKSKKNTHSTLSLAKEEKQKHECVFRGIHLYS